MESKTWWISVCGLDCSKCSIHNRTKEELDYWKEKNVDSSKIKCNGCRSERNDNHWSPDCELLDCCVYQKHLEYCGECSEFPCRKVEEWVGDLKHHQVAKERMSEMKLIGKEEWLKKNFH